MKNGGFLQQKKFWKPLLHHCFFLLSTLIDKKDGVFYFYFCRKPRPFLRFLLRRSFFVPSFALLTAIAVFPSFCYRRMARLRGSSKISPLNTRRGTATLFLSLCLSEILFVPIVIYGLYVVIFVKKIKNTIHLLNIFFACQFYISLWNHSHFCRCHHYLFIL